MKRRSFLKGSSLIAVPSILGGVPVSSIAKSSLSAMINGDSDRVLVLIQLNGGNDGLAMVIPRDQQDNLAVVRENIFIPETEFRNITDTVALHPSLQGMEELYNNSKLKIVQSVGYPDQNRSHFRSMDIWHTASDADEFIPTGWVGRYLSKNFPEFPIGFPNDDCPDPFAITLGSVVSETCQGESGNFSLAIVDPANLSQLNTPIANELAAGCGAENLDFILSSIGQTNEYGTVIRSAYEQGNNLSTKYSETDELAQKLKTVARLISGGLQSKIYVVSIGGFDTHAAQVVLGQPTIGVHADLLSSLSDSICAFQDDLKLMDLEQRVLGMTYSEFGRRIRSNDSQGTDHGTAAPLMLFGSCVTAGIVGDNPEIDRQVGQNEGVPMQHDFRSVYGSVLMDWFGAAEEDVLALFDHDFQYINMVMGCESSASEDIDGAQLALEVYPNPMSQSFRLSFASTGATVRIDLYDSIGGLVQTVCNRRLGVGTHELNIASHHLVSGPYFIRVQEGTKQKTVRIVKH